MTTSPLTYRTTAEIGAFIAAKRGSYNLTVEELAAFVEMDADDLSRVEAGERGLAVQELDRLADAFGLHFDELLRADTPEFDWMRAQLSDPDMPLSHKVALMQFETVIDDHFYLEALLGVGRYG